jgi:hypothetical protein
MKNSLRLLLVASVSAIGLAVSGSALAAFNPFLTVQQTSSKAGAPTSVGFVMGEGQDDDAIAKATIFSPAGYANTLTQAPGTTIGKAYAIVKAGALGGAVLPLAGPVVVGDPNSTALKAASLQCRGNPTANKAIWVLNTSLQGQTIQVPDFVNVVGPYLTQEICLPAPPQATFQAQLLVANFSVKGVFTNGPTGGYQWDGAFTPYGPGATPAPNAAATTEWRTYQGIPSSLTFKRAKSKRSVVTFSGRLTIGGVDPKGIRLHLYKAFKPLPAPNFTNPSENGLLGVGSPFKAKALKSNGKYTITRPKVKKKTYFQLRLEDYGFQGCDGPSPTGLPLPCAGTDIAPITAAQLKVLPPKKKKKHKH